MIENINPYIDNLLFLKDYNNSIKIYIKENKLFKDNRYFQGLLRYLDGSGENNHKLIKNIILKTYNNVSIVLEVLNKNSDNISKRKKLKIYIILINSTRGLIELSKKYQMNSFCDYVLSTLLPSLNKKINN